MISKVKNLNPQLAEDIRQAIEQIYSATKEPKQALDKAATKAARVLGWRITLSVHFLYIIIYI
jgi:hypothetical protein